MSPRLVLAGGAGAATDRLDLAVDPLSGTILEVGPALRIGPDDVVEDCRGMVVLAAPAEPHAHLDKALTGLLAPNASGDLLGAIGAWNAHGPSITHDGMVELATTALEQMVSHGTTAIRSHVNLTETVGMKPLRALMEVRDRAHRQALADVQLVALVSCPLSGDAGAVNRRLLREALDLGADVAGGAPHLDPEPGLATSIAVDIAVTHDVPIDLHVDETLDPAALHVRDLGRLAAGCGLQGRVVASHCVSLGVQTEEIQRQVGAELAASGVAVVALPQTNLYLQARTVRTSPPRAITAVRTLLDAGVVVAAGADNARDPFCSMGRLDALETASLLVMAAHLSPVEAWEACTTGARRAMGLPKVELVPGSPAEIMCIEGHSLADAIAGAGERRLVVHRGRVVARTRVDRTLIPATSA